MLPDSAATAAGVQLQVGFNRRSDPSLLDLVEAVRGGHIKEGDIVLMTAFGAGLTWAASVVRW